MYTFDIIRYNVAQIAATFHIIELFLTVIICSGNSSLESLITLVFLTLIFIS